MRALVLSLVLLLPRLAAAQLVSPGELARAHQSLEGIRNCTKCHSKGNQLGADKCLACHIELKGRVERGQGFHGRLAEPERSTCQSCHHEHQGRGFALVDWGAGGMDRFAHGRTGFALKGKHASTRCSGCHASDKISDASVQKMVREQPGRKTFLGLQTACKACHADEHRGQLGDKCESCHNESAWKPAPGFDHDKTDYALRGQHTRVACAKCHPKQTDAKSSFLKFKELPHSRCVDCHSDPHQGKFGSGCESCHNVDGWKSMKGGAKDAGFHERTRYPLRGAHTSVPCKLCHGPFPGQRARFKGLAFGRCMDCHNDAHLGQLARSKPDCERCHTVEGFVPARFEVEQHKDTRFALDGAHQAVGCNACHPRDPHLADKLIKARRRRPARPERFSFAVFQLPKKGADCESCHTDPHGGQFRGKGCATCHGTDSFHDVKFDHGKDTRFPLTGRHASAACASCHKPARAGQVVRYKPLPVACDGCHADVHLGQLAGDCARCHTTFDFKRTQFDHNDTRFAAFALEGKHAQLGCEKCHPMVAVADKKTRRYKPLPVACEGCHTDVHHGAFQGFEP